MIFNKPVTELIPRRASIRTYEKRPLSRDVIQQINEYINNLKGYFNEEVKYTFVTNFEGFGKEEEQIKLGTYGVIKGATSFIVASCPEGSEKSVCLLELGYSFEKIVLYLTSLGLGTCFLGGTFRESSFRKIPEVPAEHRIPIVSPVGYPADNSHFLAKAISLGKGKESRKRKPWEKMFFDKKFKEPLSPEDAGFYRETLEMLRLAPSANNKQPWRVVKFGENLHFFSSGAHSIDMGIALCNFHLTMSEQGFDGEFYKDLEIVENEDDKYNYVMSFRRRKVK